MSRWMDKKNVDRYQHGIERYLEDKGNIYRIVKFDWGFTSLVDLKDKDDYVSYTFEYQGDDTFSVVVTEELWNVEDKLVKIEGNVGFITVK